MLDDHEVELVLRNLRPDRFDAGFSGRVLQRTRLLRQHSLTSMLQRYFVWMVPAAVTAIAVLALHNVRASSTQRNGLDAVLALPAVTLNAAYSIDMATSSP